ncbi:complement factor H-like [Carettochelys insculpta]|uniref:complement factor H-like n=1 Tax=Carettochelys insculpta TaxID=44489 RepID=UPI003EBEF941
MNLDHFPTPNNVYESVAAPACEQPPDIDFGGIVSDEKLEYTEGDKVQYKCNPGYSLMGTEWITCNGKTWTPAPNCLSPCSITKQQLEAKNLFLSSGQRRAQLILSDHTLGFMCSEGYSLTTPSVRKCVNGHIDLPSCISERGKNCSHPPTVENGDITTFLEKRYTSGSFVEFKCQKLYALEGQNRSFCDNGNWTNAPVCLEPCTISVEEMENQRLELNDTAKEKVYLKRGDFLELRCKSGYALATNLSQSTFMVQCSESPIVYPECEEIVCNPPGVVNGRFKPQRHVYKDGDLIEITCNHGFLILNGRNIAECTKNGWVPPPRCSEITCDPPSVTNGNYMPQEKFFRDQDVITITCNPGFYFITNNRRNTAQCAQNGWLPSPRCTLRPCDYPNIENGELQSHYEYYREQYFPSQIGQSIRYTCHHGYLSKNWDRNVRCTKDGWDPMPQCLRVCSTDHLENGQFSASYWKTYIEGDGIDYSCDHGYMPENPEAKAKCTRNNWIPPPKCIAEKTCTKVTIQNGFFSDQKTGYNLNEKAKYRCYTDYMTPERTEDGTTRCRKQGWYPPPKCISEYFND